MSGRRTVRARGPSRGDDPGSCCVGEDARRCYGAARCSSFKRATPARPDILARPPDLDRMVANSVFAGGGREVGDALLDQRLVAGIGNMWKAEALWRARVLPDFRSATSDWELRRARGGRFG